MSVLAVTETITAMAVYAWIAVKYGTLHLTIACCVTPLLLLKTPESVALGLKWADVVERTLFHRLKRILLPVVWGGWALAVTIFFARWLYHRPWAGLTASAVVRNGFFIVFGYMLSAFAGIYVSMAFALLTILLTTLVIRVATSVSHVVRPLSAMRAMPGNWFRATASIDLLHPTELLPGGARDDNQHLGVIPRHMVKSALHRDGTANPFRASNLLFNAAAGLPALAYRWSIKGTAILFFPLALLTWEGPRTEPLHITQSLATRALFGGSIVVLALALKHLLGVELPDIQWYSAFLASVQSNRTMSHFFFADHILMWKVFVTIGAAIIIAGFLYADRLKNRGFTPGQKQVLDLGYFLLGCTAVATVFSLVYTAADCVLPGAFGSLWARIF